jgi:hypothetical protein
MSSTKLLPLGIALVTLACSSPAGRKTPVDETGGESGEAGSGGSTATGGKTGTGGAMTTPKDAGAGTGGAAETGGSGGGGSTGGSGGGGAGGSTGGSGGGGTGGSPATGGAGGSTEPGPTDLTKFRYSKAVKLDTTAAGANVMGNVDNFPVALALNAMNFDFTQAKDGGADVRFAKADGSLLPYAIESWDKAGQAAVVWVKVSVMGNNATQSFNMHWGSADATDASTTKTVFDTKDGFVGVWHLNEEGNTENFGYKDSSANEAHATGVMMAPGSRVDGRVGKGTWLQNSAAMPKDQWIKVDSEKRQSFNTGMKPITVSVWVLAKSFPNRSTIGGYETVISKGDTSWTFQRRGTNSDWESCTRVPAYHSCAISKTKTALNTWFHVTIVFANPTQTLYFNGARDAAATDNGWQQGDHPLGIGQQTQSLMGRRNWDGILDEVRVSNVARNADWIKLDYESQKEGAKLVSYGPVMMK